MNKKPSQLIITGILALVLAAGFVPVMSSAQGHNDPIHGDPGGGGGGTQTCPCGFAINDTAKRSFLAWLWAQLAYAEGTHGGDDGGGGDGCKACPVTDLCANIAGAQSSVPAGYVQVGSDCYPVPSASLTATPSTVSLGQASTLAWNSTNTSSCTGTNFSTGGASTGSVQVAPGADTSYSLSCAGPGGVASANASVSVLVPTASLNCTPNPVEQGASCTLAWGSSHATACTGTGFSTGGAASGSVAISPSITSAYSVSCANGYGHSGFANETVAVLVPTLFISANPPRLVTGQSSSVTYTADNVNECTLTNTETGTVVDHKTSPSSSTPSTLSGSIDTGPLGHDAPFVLSCRNSVNTFATSTLVVPISPVFKGY